MKHKCPIGLGTAAIGRPTYINIKQQKEDFESLEVFANQGLQLLGKAYDLGLRYFDTAPGYGMAEKLLIDWSSDRINDDLEIATKWGYTYVADFKLDAEVHEIKEHSIDKLDEQWSYSKELFPYLNVYQIHSATLETGVLENIEILERLAFLKDEYNLTIGITSSGINQLEILKKALDVEVDQKQLFDLYQVTYNVFEQSLLEIGDLFSQSNKKLVIKEALANGRVFPNEKYRHYSSTYAKLNQLALKYQVGVDAIALRFCIDSLPVFKVLSGASTEEHLVSNLKALDFKLTIEEVESLKECTVSAESYWSERKSLTWN